MKMLPLEERTLGEFRPGRRSLCVLNPAAGILRKQASRTALVAELRRREIEVVETSGAGTGARHAAEARDYSVIIACGGDGTVHDVVNGMDHGRQRLAILPAGRGNSVARDLGVSGMRAALEVLDRGKTRRIDVISCEIELGDHDKIYRRAVNAVAFGVLPKLVCRAKRAPGLGSFGYVLFGLLSLPETRPYEIAAYDDDFRTAPLAGVVVGNTRHFSRFIPCRTASAQDATLELMLLPSGLLSEKRLELSVVLGAGASGATVACVDRVEVRPDTPSPLYIDGEVIEGLSGLRASCMPAALECIAHEPGP